MQYSTFIVLFSLFFFSACGSDSNQPVVRDDSGPTLRSATKTYSKPYNQVVYQVEKFQYDIHGSLIRHETDNSNDGEIDLITTYTYSYDQYFNVLTESTDLSDDGILDSIDAYSYDRKGNQLSHSVDENADGINNQNQVYTYFSDGKRKTYAFEISANSGYFSVYTYAYDLHGNKLSITKSTLPEIDDAPINIDSYTNYYDAQGWLVEAHLDEDSDNGIDRIFYYSNHEDGQLASMHTGEGEYYLGITYDEQGNWLGVKRAQVEAIYTYDENNHLLTESHLTNDVIHTEIEYTNTYW